MTAPIAPEPASDWQIGLGVALIALGFILAALGASQPLRTFPFLFGVLALVDAARRGRSS